MADEKFVQKLDSVSDVSFRRSRDNRRFRARRYTVAASMRTCLQGVGANVSATLVQRRQGQERRREARAQAGPRQARARHLLQQQPEQFHLCQVRLFACYGFARSAEL